MTRTLALLLCLFSFVSSQTSRTILIYFDNHIQELRDQTKGDSSAFPFALYPVQRIIHSKFPEKAALIELLLGPTQAERDSGYSSNLMNLRLSSLNLRNSKAVVKLAGTLRLAGTLSGPRLRLQVEKTLKQFPRIQKVELYINGRKNFDSLK